MEEAPRCSARTERDSRETTQKKTANILACRQRAGETNALPAAASGKPRGSEPRHLPGQQMPDWFPSGLGLLFALAAEKPFPALRLTAAGQTPEISRIGLRGMAGKPTSKRFDRLAAKHEDVMAVGDLLIRALAIDTDIRRRALRHPGSKALLKQRKQYEKLVGRLLGEHKILLADYLAIIRLLTKR